MPTSALETWPRFLNLVETVPHRSVLDVGPGHGKAAVLLREYLNSPPTLIDAVEAWGPYVDAFRLPFLYDHVYVADVRAERWEGVQLLGGNGGAVALDVAPVRPVDARRRLAAYDVVVMGDVIEHIDKPAALALLDRIPGAVVVNTPVEFFDNPPDLPPPERHVSHWGEDDWQALGDRVDHVEQAYGAWLVRLHPQ